MGFWDTIGEFFDTTHRASSPHASTYEGLPEDQDNWGCDAWIVYYKRNKAIMGKESSLDLLRVDNSNLGWTPTANWCGFNAEFVNYFEGEGVEDVGGIIGDATQTTANVTEAASILSGGAKGGIKMASLMIPIAVVGAGLYFADKYTKDTRRKR